MEKSTGQYRGYLAIPVADELWELDPALEKAEANDAALRLGISRAAFITADTGWMMSN
jgi:hypothetical protein